MAYKSKSIDLLQNQKVHSFSDTLCAFFKIFFFSNL